MGTRLKIEASQTVDAEVMESKARFSSCFHLKFYILLF